MDIYPINRIYQLGFTAKLQCRATGYPQPRIIWMRENVPLVNTTRTTLQNDGSLIIHPYKREDAGNIVLFQAHQVDLSSFSSRSICMQCNQ